MSWYAGAVSAATLGFIAHNLPGAYQGYRSYSEFMAYRRRKGSKHPRPVKAGGKRKASKPIFRTKKKTRHLKRRPVKKASTGRDSDVGISKCFVGRGGRGKLGRGLKYHGGLRQISSVSGGVIDAAVGLQAAQVVNLFFDGASNSTTLNAFLDHSVILNNLEAEEAYQTAQNANQAGVSGDIGAGTRVYNVRRWVCETTYKNQSEVPVQLWLYDIVARNDQKGSFIPPTTVWADGIAVNSSSAFGGGIQEGLFGNTSTAGINQIGATPFQAKSFGSWFKVVKVTKVMIHPGSNHQHIVVIKPKFPFNAEKTLSLYCRRMQTYMCMAIAHGGIINGTGADLTKVTTSEAKLDYISTCRIEAQQITQNRTVYCSYNNLATAVTAGEAVVEDTDGIVTMAVA
jgi:hypothetical protein